MNIKLLSSIVWLGFANVVAAQAAPEWQMNCFGSAPDPAALSCDVRQRVLQEGTEDVLFEVTFRRFPDNSVRMTVLSPLGYYLPNGLGLAVDGREIARLPVDTCRSNGCISVSSVDDEFIRNIRQGKNFSLVFWVSRDENREVIMPLSGFNDRFSSFD